MKSVMFKCQACHRYTLEPKCPACGEPTMSPMPARFSPQDKYGEYRRAMKRANKEGTK